MGRYFVCFTIDRDLDRMRYTWSIIVYIQLGTATPHFTSILSLEAEQLLRLQAPVCCVVDRNGMEASEWFFQNRNLRRHCGPSSVHWRRTGMRLVTSSFFVMIYGRWNPQFPYCEPMGNRVLNGLWIPSVYCTGMNSDWMTPAVLIRNYIKITRYWSSN